MHQGKSGEGEEVRGTRGGREGGRGTRHDKKRKLLCCLPDSPYIITHFPSPVSLGKWDWHSYVLKGKVQPLFAEHCPETNRLLQEFHKQAFLMLGTPFSFSFFSTLHAQSVIAPHSGPSNLRLRCHLPLIVPKAGGGKEGGKEGGSRQASSAPATPDGASSFSPSSTPPMDEYGSLEDIQAAVPCGIRIGDQVRAWEEGKCLVFDDAYEHEVWNRTEEERVLLLVDFWHVSFSF